MNTELVNFYQNKQPNSSGDTLADILSWDDQHWEQRHDFIQWLFPLKEPSQFNPDAPLLDDETIRLFKTTPSLQKNLSKAVQRAAAFLGIYMSDMVKPKWFQKNNHNCLRVTRMLTSLQLFEHREADMLYNWVMGLAQKYPEHVTDTTVSFWANAMLSSLIKNEPEFTFETLTKNQIKELYFVHARRFTNLLNSESKYINVKECNMYLDLWESIYLKIEKDSEPNFTKQEISEIKDAIDCGDYDDLLRNS